MASLFEINESIMNCVKLENSDGYVDVSTGELIDVAALDALKMEYNTKVRNIACWIRNLKSDEEQLDNQEKIFRERKIAKRKKREQLESYLASVLNGKKWENEEVSVLWRKSESVEVTDQKKLSSYYLRYREPEVNKTLLKADLKAGVKLDGAVLASKLNMSVK